MTSYLLDRDVMSQLDLPEAKRHLNVRAWLASVPDKDLFVSAVTMMEAWRGFSMVRGRAAGNDAKLAECDGYERAFEALSATLVGRIIAVDGAVAKLWGKLLGERDKNRNDACVAATASVHNLVVATRNVSDFAGRRAQVIDPFAKTARIVTP